MKNRILISAFLITGLFHILQAQIGIIDPTFNASDNGLGSGANSSINRLLVLPDDKTLIIGNFQTYDNLPAVRFARLDIDGRLDLNFSSGSGPNFAPESIDIQPDGKLLLGGTFTSYNGTGRNRIVRTEENGAIDLTFNPGTGANGSVKCLAVQTDGKILAGGLFTSFNGTLVNRLIRLNSDGSVDGSFTIGTGLDASPTAIMLQPDGKIVVVGLFTTYDGIGRNRIARLNPDGTLDGTFNPGTGANGAINCAVLQPDGNLLIGGAFTSYNGATSRGISRILNNGSKDPSFSIGTGVVGGDVNTMLLETSGKILLGGTFNSYNSNSVGLMARINSNGAYDPSLVQGTGAEAVSIVSIGIQSDGKYLFTGNIYGYNGIRKNRLMRINQTGLLDHTYILATASSGLLQKSILLPNGKIIVFGLFAFYDGTYTGGIARLNSDGTLDPGFNPGSGLKTTTDVIYTAALQADGKLIIAGDFHSYNGIAVNYIARINTDGSLDPTFNPGAGPNANIRFISTQTDEKLVVVGSFTTYDGVSRGKLARLNTDGSLDVTYNSSVGFALEPASMKLQPDDKAVLCGTFTTYNGVTKNGMVRVNIDGSEDPTFSVGTGPTGGNINFLHILMNGKILISGNFSGINGTTRNGFSRLNADGSNDPTFLTGTAFGGSIVRTVAEYPDGKILLGGSFTTFNGITQRFITRLNSNGTFDPTFNNGGFGFNQLVSDLVFQPDEKIIAVGGFSQYNNVGRNSIVRLMNCISPTLPTLQSDLVFNCGTQTATLSIGSGNLNSALNWTWYSGSCGGVMVGQGNSIQVTPLVPTTYFARGTGGCVSPGLCASISILTKPTLNSVSTTAVCAGNSAIINLAGLVPSQSFSAKYTINGQAQPIVLNLLSDNLGNGSFTTIPLPLNYNGKNLVVTGMAFTNGGPCGTNFSINNSTQLTVDPLPNVSIVANTIVCEGQSAPVIFNFNGGNAWTLNYSINNVPQPQVVTASPIFSTLFTTAGGTSTYTVNSLTNGSCLAPSGNLDTATITVPVQCGIVWNGSQSSDWSDPLNWTPSNDTPSEHTNVFIPGNRPNYPILDGSNPSSPICQDITLSGNASVKIESSSALEIRGNLDASGQKIYGDGKLVFNGLNPQVINGDILVQRLIIDNPLEFFISDESKVMVSPNGLLFFTENSHTLINGELVLMSDISSTAQVGVIPTSAIVTGKLTFERFLTHGSGNGSWYFIGSPLSGNYFTDFADDFRVIGLSSGFGLQGGSILPSNEPERSTIFKYVEAMHNVRSDTVQKIGWRIPGNENVIPGIGYRVWVNYYSNSRHKFDARGDLTRGSGVANDFSFPTLTRNEYSPCYPTDLGVNRLNCNEEHRGWNLLANPFPSDLDWDAIGGWTKPPEMNNAFYTWNSAMGGYRAYLGAGGVDLGVTLSSNANPGVIPSGQAFFVNLTSPGTYQRELKVKELAKSPFLSGTFIRKSTITNPQLRIRLSKPENELYRFDAMVRFMEGANDGFDQNKDLQSFTGTNFEFAIGNTDEGQLLLNSIAPISETRTIPLTMKYNGNSGEFRFNFLDVESLIESTTAYIKDNFTGGLMAIESSESFYNFDANDELSLNSNRFELLLVPNGINLINSTLSKSKLSIFPNPFKGQKLTIIDTDLDQDSQFEISDVIGRKISFTILPLDQNTTQINFNTSLPSGQYLIKIKNKNGIRLSSILIR